MDHDTLRRLRPLVAVAGFVVAVAALHGARALLIPIALATLLAFLLSPIVSALHRRHLGRVGSVVAVLALTVLAVGGVGWMIAAQLGHLARDLPRYQATVTDKIGEVRRTLRGTTLERMQGALDEVVGEIEKDDRRRPARERPLPVVVRDDDRSLLRRLPELTEELAAAGLVLVLVLFMLVERQELRNRFVRLAGSGRLAVTTRALDEAGTRIGRYLLTQSLINVSLGAVFAAGLALLSIPHAALWGVAVALGRFVPFVGVWVGGLLPAALALAVFQRWTEPLVVVAYFTALELLVNIVVEPVLLSQRAGVSKVALLVSVAFWTWLWGPIGLILAAPLTVCLVVLARHVPALHFVVVALGDEPALETSVGYYQRLVAGDRDEAAEIAGARLAAEPPGQVFDEVLIPALARGRRDRGQGRIDSEDERFIVAATAEIVDDVAPEPAPPAAAAVTILGVPVHDETDALALRLLGRVINPALGRLQRVSPTMLTAEVLHHAEELQPAAVCVASLVPGGLARTRYLVKRLRGRFPELKILVGRWGGPVDAAERAGLVAAGADAVGVTLRETGDQILALMPMLSRPAAAAQPEAA